MVCFPLTEEERQARHDNESRRRYRHFSQGLTSAEARETVSTVDALRRRVQRRNVARVPWVAPVSAGRRHLRRLRVTSTWLSIGAAVVCLVSTMYHGGQAVGHRVDNMIPLVRARDTVAQVLDRCKTECIRSPDSGVIELPLRLETMVDRSLSLMQTEDKLALFGTLERQVDYSLLLDFNKFYPEVRAAHDAAIQESLASLPRDFGCLVAFGSLAGLFIFWSALSRLQRRRWPTQRQIAGAEATEEEITNEAYDLLLAEHDAALEPLRVKSEEASRLTQDMWASVHIAEAQAESVKDDATFKAKADAQIQHFRALLQTAEKLEESAKGEYRAKEELLRKYREAQVGQVRLALIAGRQGDALARVKAVVAQSARPRVDTEGLEVDAAARASSLADTETMEAMLELAATRIAAGY